MTTLRIIDPMLNTRVIITIILLSCICCIHASSASSGSIDPILQIKIEENGNKIPSIIVTGMVGKSSLSNIISEGQEYLPKDSGNGIINNHILSRTVSVKALPMSSVNLIEIEGGTSINLPFKNWIHMIARTIHEASESKIAAIIYGVTTENGEILESDTLAIEYIKKLLPGNDANSRIFIVFNKEIRFSEGEAPWIEKGRLKAWFKKTGVSPENFIVYESDDKFRAELHKKLSNFKNTHLELLYREKINWEIEESIWLFLDDETDIFMGSRKNAISNLNNNILDIEKLLNANRQEKNIILLKYPHLKSLNNQKLLFRKKEYLDLIKIIERPELEPFVTGFAMGEFSLKKIIAYGAVLVLFFAFIYLQQNNQNQQVLHQRPYRPHYN